MDSRFASADFGDRGGQGRTLARCSLAFGLSLVSGVVTAQPAERPGAVRLEEIVVTAERRESTVQQAPLAVSAFDEVAIERSRLDTAFDLQFQIPNLVFSQTAGQGQIFLRGVGLEIPTMNGEPGVAFNVDGVYQGRLFASTSFYSDLARIEVLRGPQGTLYGRNATGGALNLITRAPPSELEIDGFFEYGSFDRIASYASIGAPTVDDRVKARISVTTEDRNGYRRNAFLDEDTDDGQHRSARAAVEITPNDDLSIMWRGDWSRDDGSGGIANVVFEQPVPPLNITPSLLGGTVTGDPREVLQDLRGDLTRILGGTSVTVNWQIEDVPLLGDLALKSITAWRYSEAHQLSDSDGTEVNLFNLDASEQAHQWSEELVFTSQGDGDLDWIAGVFAYYEEATADYDFFLSGAGGLGFDAVQETLSVAGFTQGTYHLTDRWRATAGVRVTHDRKDLEQSIVNILTGPCSGAPSRDWTEWTPKFGTEFDAADDVLLYASVTRGYKGGGFNLLECDADYDPEILWAYEAGVKSEWFGHRLRMNLVGFYYDYTDLQYLAIVLGTAEISNASDAEIAGVELETVALPFDRAAIDMTLGYLYGEFKEFSPVDPFDPDGGPVDLSGNRLTRSPEISFHLGAQYELPLGDFLSATPRIEYTWSDSYFFDAFNTPDSRQGSYSMLNLRVTLSTRGYEWEEVIGDWTLAGFVENLLDEDISQLRIRNATIGATTASFGPPRAAGFRLAYRWGR